MVICFSFRQSHFIPQIRVTNVIRTRPKTALFKSFRRFTLERRQPSCGLNPKNPIKITRFQVEDFYSEDFWRDKAQNAENPLWIFEYFNEVSTGIRL